MKKMMLILGLSIFYFNANAQRIYTDEVQEAQNKNFHTFALLDRSSEPEPGSAEALIIESDEMQSIFIFEDDEYPGADVKASIDRSLKQELIRKDLNYDETHPDVLISYTVFGKDGELRGEFTDEDELNNTPRNEKYKVQEGTLLITVTEVDSGQTIWQGFEDGAFNKDEPITENEAIKAVTNIMKRLAI